jgi:phospholipase C
MSTNRRSFIAKTSAVALEASAPLAKAGPRSRVAGSIADVEHVVIFMQENRSFDHYFGSLRGVRGFDDPWAVRLPNGAPVWAQRQLPQDGGELILPYRFDTLRTGAERISGLDHSWRGSWDRWKRYDVWMPEKGPLSMGYFTREDLPYYYALADAFTLCDAYHCSIHGPTGPNRLFLFSGSNGLSVGQVGVFNISNEGGDDNDNADMGRDDPKFSGLPWTPYAARLEAAGVSWRVYQEYDNFGDNSLSSFAAFRRLDRSGSAYRRGRAIVPGSTAENAAASRGEHLVAAFAADVQADRLPSVSWIVASAKMSEHPDAPPAYGETLIARLVAALAANPQIWKKTAFILNYDENDGFFDHMPPPVPATRPDMGRSTVDLSGEVYRGEPVGLGPRVPLLVVSPWTRGGWVNSEVSDHTSVLRFLERRFGVAEPNIGPWRRAVCGDLTSMFDFNVSEAARTDVAWLGQLPDTARYRAASDEALKRPAPRYPAVPAMPRQEPGVRPARPLPYALEVSARWKGDLLELTFLNRGRTGAVFTVYAAGRGEGPWSYTVEAGKSLSETWPRIRARGQTYDLSVHGPNGFFRRFRGDWAMSARPEVRLFHPRAQGRLRAEFSNSGVMPCVLTVAAAGRTGETRLTCALAAGAVRSLTFDMPVEGAGWYDLRVTAAAAPGFERRLSGHVETGRPSLSFTALEGVDAATRTREPERA